jgi:hypothetical protein
VLEIGCGPLGGFVPALRTEGYDAEGIDPEAPDGPHYHRVEFKAYAPRQPAAAMVASTSLHHVSDLDTVFDRITGRLEPGGVLVVIEWARERFDEATARCASTGSPTANPAGCTATATTGSPPAKPGTPTSAAGPPARACTPVRTSCARWPPDS